MAKVILWAFLLLAGCWGQPPPNKLAPWRDTLQVEQLMNPDTSYPFYEMAADTLFLAAHLARTWQKLSEGQKVRILHIGDSHLQGDVQGREIRKKLYALWGPGGRGYVFPYALASTSSAYDYVSTGEGQWLYARSVHQPPVLPLGITGIAIGTYDSSATWRIRWAPEYTPAAPASARIGLLTRSTRRDLQMQITYNDSAAPLLISLDSGYHIFWAAIQKSITFLEGRLTYQNSDSLSYVELHGIFIEDTGRVTYYTMGINGARLSDLPALPLLQASLRLFSPQLVVIDLGTNDLCGWPGNPTAYRNALEAAIDTIRQALPEVDILITTPLSFYRRMRPLAELQLASQIARWVAVQKAVALWDAAVLMGEMRQWRLAGLAHPDMVHLLPAGYSHKGQLYVRALLHGYWRYLTGRLPSPQDEGRGVILPDSLLVVRTIPATPLVSQWGGTSSSAASPQTYAPPRPAYSLHRVRPGETLGAIAQRYRVSVRAIQAANGLRGTMIRAGQVLRIPGGQGGLSAPTSPSSPPRGSSAKYHIVRSGESLWSIAQQYGTTVEALRRANKLSAAQAIHPGQKLLIP